MKDLFELKREFLEFCELEKGQSTLTISNYDRYLSKFLNWLKSYKEQETRNKSQEEKLVARSLLLVPSDIDQESVRQYRLFVNRRQDRKGKELKATTQNYHMLALRAFLRYLSFRGVPSLSPEKIGVAKTGDREITFLNSEEIEKILNTPNTETMVGIRDRAMLEILFSTGLRVSELVALDVDQINFESGEIAVLGKGRKLRVVFLSENALFWVDQYLKNRGYARKDDGNLSNIKIEEPLFLSSKKGRITVRSVERIVQKCAAQAGLSKKVSPHTFRHSFATDLLTAGADVRSVQSLLGHSSITTTQIYTHITDQHLREIHQAFHGTRRDGILRSTQDDIERDQDDKSEAQNDKKVQL